MSCGSNLLNEEYIRLFARFDTSARVDDFQHIFFIFIFSISPFASFLVTLSPPPLTFTQSAIAHSSVSVPFTPFATTFGYFFVWIDLIIVIFRKNKNVTKNTRVITTQATTFERSIVERRVPSMDIFSWTRCENIFLSIHLR